MKHFLFKSLFILFIIFSKNALSDIDPWPYLHKQYFQNRDINENSSYVKLYTPELAADASLVPISIRLSPEIIRDLKKLYLIIDRNPDPYAMEIEFQEGFEQIKSDNERTINTRVRVNNFSEIRAVLETKDKKLYMDTSFVAGSGGCSSPPSMNLEDALKDLGKIKIKMLQDTNISENWRQAIIKIRHPNFTGMQPTSKNEDGFIPARYINKVLVKYGETPMMIIHSGITISENPSFRFDFNSNTEEFIVVEAMDSKNSIFKSKH